MFDVLESPPAVADLKPDWVAILGSGNSIYFKLHDTVVHVRCFTSINALGAEGGTLVEIQHVLSGVTA